MRVNDIEKILSKMGYQLVRNSKHKIWSNGTKSVPVPHSKEINRNTAKGILKTIGYLQ